MLICGRLLPGSLVVVRLAIIFHLAAPKSTKNNVNYSFHSTVFTLAGIIIMFIYFYDSTVWVISNYTYWFLRGSQAADRFQSIVYFAEKPPP